MDYGLTGLDWTSKKQSSEEGPRASNSRRPQEINKPHFHLDLGAFRVRCPLLGRPGSQGRVLGLGSRYPISNW